MAIVNRTLDASEQRKMYSASYGVIGTGATLMGVPIPSDGSLAAVRIAVNGVSGSPTALVVVHRFIVGTGLTSIAACTLLTHTAFGTSGIQSVGLAAAGSTLLQLLAGDYLAVATGGANSAVASMTVSAVVQNIQDIKTAYGV